jgi:hypothetical protein
MATLRLIASTFLNSAVYGALLLVPAGTVLWWRAWVVLGAVFTGILATRLWVLRDDSGLLAERRKPPMQRGQPLADKLLVVAFVTVFPAYLVFIPLDVFRLHLIAKPGVLVSSLGLLLFAAGLCLISFAFRENTFAAAIVKHQSDRGQTVIDSGVYSVVRHPLFGGRARDRRRRTMAAVVRGRDRFDCSDRRRGNTSRGRGNVSQSAAARLRRVYETGSKSTRPARLVEWPARTRSGSSRPGSPGCQLLHGPKSATSCRPARVLTGLRPPSVYPVCSPTISVFGAPSTARRTHVLERAIAVASIYQLRVRVSSYVSPARTAGHSPEMML